MTGPTDHVTRTGLLRRLAAAPARVAEAATSGNPRESQPGEWTAQQVVLHLVAVEAGVFQRRLLDLRAAAVPTWSWVEPDPGGAPPGESIARSLERFALVRGQTLALVGALDEYGWRRFGEHATLGRLDVAGLLALADRHDEEHLASLTGG
jgi:hypothetical protein